MTLSKLALTTALIGAIAVPSFAQTAATTSTALTLRENPSEFSAPVQFLQTGDEVMIEGCLEDLSWCKVTAGDDMMAEGWVSGNFIRTAEDADPVAQLNFNGDEQVDVQIVTVETQDSGNDAGGAAAGAVIGVLAAAATGGATAAIMLGAAGGAVLGDIAEDITEEEVTYITNNRVETIYLDGEVVIGSTIPGEIATYEIPNSDYRYLVVNNTSVIVDADTGAIVAIIS
ncbi:MAG: DUF1236 domain-containing protein [Yoonia sp.]|uniref:DUF1236 domain-containing protein n=1 Tax=Yoonia sp. TaxID=2212373 RepID=UPI003EF64D94